MGMTWIDERGGCHNDARKSEGTKTLAGGATDSESIEVVLDVRNGLPRPKPTTFPQANRTNRAGGRYGHHREGVDVFSKSFSIAPSRGHSCCRWRHVLRCGASSAAVAASDNTIKWSCLSRC